jgi:hypothetical protein
VVRRIGSNPNPLDFAHAHIIIAPVVEAGRFSVRVTGHALRDFDAIAVRQIIGNAGRPKTMAAFSLSTFPSAPRRCTMYNTARRDIRSLLSFPVLRIVLRNGRHLAVARYAGNSIEASRRIQLVMSSIRPW